MHKLTPARRTLRECASLPLSKPIKNFFYNEGQQLSFQPLHVNKGSGLNTGIPNGRVVRLIPVNVNQFVGVRAGASGTMGNTPASHKAHL